MRKVTYGVTGLIDWRAQIPVGKARLGVHFSGGAITKYGVTPAEFTTTDPITQRIIEDSAYYRTGKIKILRSVGRPEAMALSRKHEKPARDAYAAATLPFDTAVATTAEAEPSADIGTKVIEVGCIEDAMQYMRQHHNVSSVLIRTPETLKSVAAQYGITFDIAQP